MHTSLPEALDAHRSSLETACAGRVSYYVDDSCKGRPLLLLHSINAAPSAIEMQPLFEHYRRSRPVYALELPGFGFSERADIDYSPALYGDTIAEVSASLFDGPVDAIALSTTSEFLARAALSAARRFSSLVLISPTGLGSREPPSGAASDRLRKIFSLPVLTQGLYRMLTSRASIRYFLNLSFEGEPPVEMIDQAWATARQPGARFAPYRFLSMALFTQQASTKLYRPLEVPTLVLYDQDPNINFDRLPALLKHNSLVSAQRITPTRGLPHWEDLVATVRAIDAFWGAAVANEKGAP